MTICFVNDWQGYKAGMTRTLSPGQEAAALGDRAAVAVVDEALPLVDVKQDPTSGKLYGAGGKEIAVGGGIAWRQHTYFALPGKGYNADSRQTNPTSSPAAVKTEVVSGTPLVRQSGREPFDIVEPQSRWRAVFSNGAADIAAGALRLKISAEVPNRNGAGRIIIPGSFGGMPYIDIPAGGGRIVEAEFTWPVLPTDKIDLIWDVTNPSNPNVDALALPVFGALGSSGTANPAGVYDTALQNHNPAVDVTTILRGTAPWTAQTYTTGCFGVMGLYGMDSTPSRKPTLDIFSDSIASDSALSYINRICTQLRIPFANYGLPGSSQLYFPSTALQRIRMARGDIAYLAMGHNSADNASLLLMIRMLKGLGYRRVIVALVTDDFTSTDGFATTANQTKSADRGSFHNANLLDALGTLNGPDRIWNLPSICQPGGKWVPLWTTDGVHLSATGHQQTALAIITLGWHLDLLS